MHVMPRPVLSALLALVIAVTGFQTAAARAQSAAVDVVELCIGTTVVTVLVDENGQPVEHHHLCPEGAFALFVAEAGGFVPSAPLAVWTRWTSPVSGFAAAGNPAPAAQARGPPVAL